jgi:hypothetical protein
MTVRAVINARRLSFAASRMTPRPANAPSPPCWRMRSGAYHNDNHTPLEAA